MNRRKIIIDTSAWLSYILTSEKDHQKISKILLEEIEKGTLIFTSNYIIDETVTRLVYDTNWKITHAFIGFIRESINSKSLIEVWVDEAIEEDAFKILGKFHEHKLSLTDATTVSIIRRLSINAIVTLDKDFIKAGIPTL